ncbi:MAG: glycosyltransferase family 39 protein [Hyphomicrobiales bacterium]|nr:glycosyltransferase family 39 protein [Hyphomicrobiales bacterium]MBV8825573.1 glycosyltransferase family 39 protein [Hyphomicrobiales bacterium]MBV9430106.1 glycosyltransferase family 39 protein [Bradyrhizobiaceae bacterium]
MQAISDAALQLKGPQQTASGWTTTIAVLLDRPASAYLAAAILLLPSVVWIFRDARVWPWDHAYYATLALQIRYALHDGALAWLSAFLTVPDSRAPLLPWLAQATVPLTRILGDPERALLLTNVATAGITLGLIYSATRRLGGSLAVALTAMLACAGTSDFIAFNQQFLVEAGQAMAVAGLAWVALRAADAAWPRLAAGALFWATVAMLAKTTSVGYVLPFLLYIAIVRSASHRQRAAAVPLDFFLLFGSLAFAGVAIAWYAMHWPGIVVHINEATITKDIVLLYGSERPLLAKLGFWSWALLQALSPFPWLAGLVAIVVAWALATGAVRVARGGLANLLRRAVESRLLFALCLAGTIFAALIAYSRMIAEDVRYLAPMVPLVVLLLAWSLVTLRGRWLTAVAAVLLAGNWGATHAMVQGLVPLPDTALWYLQAPHSDFAAMARMARAVAETCDRSRLGRIEVIGADLVDFSAPSAWLYAEKMRRNVGYRCEYTSLGYLESDPQRAIKRLYDINADYFVTLPLSELPATGTNPFDRVSKPVAEWIATSPDFERLTPETDALAIYRRRR